MPALHFKGKIFVQNHHLAVKHHQLVHKKELSLTNKVSLADNLIIQGDNLKAFPKENINDLEKSVALYLDEQEKLLWWNGNMSRQDYHIRGWKRNKIYPDFVAADKHEENDDYGTVYVLETKGIHLKNEDTKYKQDVFAFCNELGAKKTWKELFNEFPNHDFEFQVVFDDELQNKVNQLIANV